MMRSYVCHQCRSRLSQRAPSLRSPQWQPRAAFISLRDAKPQPDAEPQKLPEDADRKRDTLQNDASSVPRVRKTPVGGPPGGTDRSGLGRYSRYGQNAEPRQNGQQKPIPQPFGPSSADRPDAIKSRDFTPSYAQSIADALNDKDIHLAWSVFTTNYTSRDCQALTKPSMNDVPLLNRGTIFYQLCDAIIAGFCRGHHVPATPTEMLFRYEQLGIATPLEWRNALVYVTTRLLWSISGANKGTRDTQSLLSELIALWRLFFQCKGRKDDPLESINAGWDSISDSTPANTQLTTLVFANRLQHYHPKFKSEPPLQFCATTFFNLFDEINRNVLTIPDPLREQSAPFVRLLTSLLAGSNVSYVFKHTEVSNAFQALPEDFRKTIIDQINSAPHRAMKLIGSHTLPEGEAGAPDHELSALEKASNLEQFFLKRINRAVFSQAHVGTMEKLWEEVVAAYRSQDQKTEIPPLIYNQFLVGFLTLYQSDHAVKVWNHMVASGVKPDLRTWSAMMQGCVNARDLNGLNGAWDRMLQSGLKPDNYLWTTRINGLLQLHQVNQALQALDEMGKKWLAAETAIKNPPRPAKGRKIPQPSTKPVNNFTKPSIEVVNGAISAIVAFSRRGTSFKTKVDFVHKILQWAGNFDVKPNVITYNVLVQLYLDQGDYATVFKVLRQMENEGIEGDLHTHTMLISAAFDTNKFDDLTEIEQAGRILKLFNELESGGFKLNAVMYSSTITRLLKQYQNILAVNVVIEHMLARGLTVSPQIYTSLAMHFFAQDPPDIDSVDGLVSQIIGPPMQSTDNALFHRLIQGYAANGEVGKMMSLLTRMSKHGKLPDWRTIKAIVHALVEAGDWERARLIVKDVQMGEGIAEGGVLGGSQARSRFFALIREMDAGLTESLAGDDWQGRASVTGRTMGEQVDGPRDEGMSQVEGQEMEGLPEYMQKEGQTDSDLDDEYVNAEHASYLSDAQEPERQWRPQGNGSVGGVPL